MKRKDIYLDTVPLQEAVNIFFGELKKTGFFLNKRVEVINVSESLGRVTAEPVFAKISSPHYNAAAVDGVAVLSEKTYGASEKTPVVLFRDEFIVVDTGDPLPPNTDSVIMMEDVNFISDDKIELISPALPWQNVRLIGEDIVATELIVPENHRIRPQDIGAILASGHVNIKVYKKPVFAVIPTGTELVNPGDELKPGDIIEYNSKVLEGLLKEWGAEAVIFEKITDDYQKVKYTVEKALKVADGVIINAGSSAGREDFTASIIRELGRLLVHGVAIKPGKPVILGIIEDKPVLGIPGYPVSAFLTMELFAKPLIFRMQGLPENGKEKIKARCAKRIVSNIGSEEFVRVKIGKIGSEFVASPLNRGAGTITSLVRADGIIRIPANKEGIEAGEYVEVELLRKKEDIENTIVIIGSHDVAIDILANEVKKKYPDINLSSANVGSMGGIMALKRKEAHAAGMHLLDPDTGEYNIPYIKRYLREEKIILVNLAFREQGLIVKKGNPKNIKGIEDLKRKDVTFVNRQKGAGTRLLLDLKLRELNISPEEVRGYEREEFTHLAVAAQVAGGTADCGLGILSAAKALDLDFIPISSERFDLAFLYEYFDLDAVQKLLKVMKSEEFKEKLKALGGYDTSLTGEIIGGD